MSIFKFYREQLLPITIDQAWDFFSNPKNLARITPPSLDFKIISNLPNEVYEGLTIEYRVKPLLNIPLKWVSLIKMVEKPYRFSDEQLTGPYAYWHHRHIFTRVSGGINMVDDITYRLPCGFLSPMVNALIVSKELTKIFEFRRKTLEQLFGIYKKP